MNKSKLIQRSLCIAVEFNNCNCYPELTQRKGEFHNVVEIWRYISDISQKL